MDLRLALFCLIFLGVCFGHSENPFEDWRIKLEDVVLEETDPSISIKTFPQILSSSGQQMTVKLRGVSNPSQYDLLALYSPANVVPTKTSPIKFISAKVFGSNYLSTGNADVIFRMTNLRSNFKFAFMRGVENMENKWDLFNRTSISAYSNVADFSNYFEPLQGRLSLTGKPNEMKVMWSSGDKISLQHLKIGDVSGQYSRKIRAKSTTYKASDLCGAPATTFGWRDPGFLHSATAFQLKAGTRYYYTFGSDAGGFSKESSFVAPSQPSPYSVINFAAFGDMGKGDDDNSFDHWPYEADAPATVKKIMEVVNDIDLVLHVGDISYAVGYSAQWDDFMNQISPVASKVPWMTLPGNHERDFPNSGVPQNGTDSGGECGIPYYMRFPMLSPTRDQPWYSFEYGPVHFVTMSTEHDFTIGSIQNQWIENDLKNVNRSVTPWIVFSGHRPMYIDSTNYDPISGDKTVATALRTHVEPMFQRYQVDIAYWGHHHTYQRSCPVYQTKCAEGNTVHVVIGMAGFGLTHNLEKKKPSYMLYVDDTEHGFTKIRATGKSFKMDYFGNKSGLKDSFTLTKK